MNKHRLYQIGFLLGLVPILLLAAAPLASSETLPPAEEESETMPVLVGRISHVEGQLLRYVPEDQDWVATVKDAPFGLNDALRSDEEGKAEIILPNNTRVRTGADTQIQMIKLEEDVTEMDISSGTARFYNRGQGTVIKVITPFGYIVGPGETVFDLYVGSSSVEVVALQGQVDFVHSGNETKYEVIAGSSSLLADSQQITSGEGMADGEWDSWNAQREALWQRRLQASGNSAKYLPDSLVDDAYALEENGTWERVYYEGSHYTCWRPHPHRIYVGWTPYTVGRWTSWYGDQCWIPGEPFGYITHHYGCWISVNHRWYWAPPVVRRILRPLPLLPIPFGWYPGRVSWIHSGLYIGWIPLAPFEPYYCHHRWGPHVIYTRHTHPIDVHISRYHYRNHAVIIHRDRLYRGSSYRNVRIASTDRRAALRAYQAAPVIDDKLLKPLPLSRERFRYTDVDIKEKPHSSNLERIRQNQVRAKETEGISKEVIRRDLDRIKSGDPRETAPIESPRRKGRLAPKSKIEPGKGKTHLLEKEQQGPNGIGAEPRRVAMLEPPDPSGPKMGPPKPISSLPDQTPAVGSDRPVSSSRPGLQPVPSHKGKTFKKPSNPGQSLSPSAQQSGVQSYRPSPRESFTEKPQGAHRHQGTNRGTKQSGQTSPERSRETSSASRE